MEKKEWLEWRRQGVGGSDAAAVMGISPYKTPYQLWLEKTGKEIDEEDNEYIKNKGNQYEPFARAKYELINDMEMPPIRCQHKDIAFLRATMDGANQENLKGIEIKYTGKDVHEATKLHKTIPAHYMAQIQHQLLVTGFKSIDYLSYYVASGNDENGNKIKPNPKTGDLVVVEVVPDMAWIERYLSQVGYFWNCVIKDEAPELTDKDIRNIKGNDELALKYIEAKKLLDQSTKNVADLKTEIEKLVAGIVRAEFGKTGLTVVRSYRKGNVDYKKVPELKGIDLEPYRGKSSMSLRINVPGEKE